MSTENKIRVAIIDDHFVVRYGFKYMLQYDSAMMFVGDAPNAKNAAEFVADTKPDVLLLDIRLPGVDGVTAFASLRATNPDLKVIMLTTSEREEDIFKSINLGVNGYVLKDSEPAELLAAIRAVAKGETWYPEAVKHIYDLRTAIKPLSSREQEVLTLLVKGFSNPDIGVALGLSRETVKIHLRNVFAKLGVSDRVEAVTAAISRGLVEVEV